MTLFYEERLPEGKDWVDQIWKFSLVGVAPNLYVKIWSSLRQSDPREWDEDETEMPLTEFQNARAYADSPALLALNAYLERSR